MQGRFSQAFFGQQKKRYVILKIFMEAIKMYYIFAKGYDRHACDYTEVYFGARKTAAEAKELCKDIHRTRPEFCEVWYERSNEPEEEFLSYRGSCYNRRYYQ